MTDSPFREFKSFVEDVAPWVKKPLVKPITKKPRKKPSFIEHTYQTYFFNWVNNYFLEDEKHGKYINGKFISPRMIFAIPNGGKRPTKTYMNRSGARITYCPEGKRLKDEGARAGTLDIFVSIPAGCYHGMYMETKPEGKYLSPDQKKFKAAAEAQGYKCVVVKDHIEAQKELLHYLNS